MGVDRIALHNRYFKQNELTLENVALSSTFEPGAGPIASSHVIARDNGGENPTPATTLAVVATRPQIVATLLMQGLPIVAFGCAVGLAMGLTVSHLLQGMLYAVTPSDPETYATIYCWLSWRPPPRASARVYGPPRRIRQRWCAKSKPQNVTITATLATAAAQASIKELAAENPHSAKRNAGCFWIGGRSASYDDVARVML